MTTTTERKSIYKTVRIGTARPEWTKVGYSVFCRIEFDGERLSITGVEGPLRSGNARGSCGQIVMSEWDIKKYSPGWDAAKVKRFRDIWDKWHLNDIRSGTPAQSAVIEEAKAGGWRYEYDAARKLLESKGLLVDAGYEYGTGWLTEEVPNDVIEFLRSLPDTDKVPAWV